MTHTGGDDDALKALLQALPDQRILTSPEERAAYSHDAKAGAAAGTPAAVVLPTTVEEVRTVLRAAHRLGTSVVPRGAGTGVAGGANATDGCVVLSLERMDRILELSPEDEVAVVEPGVINGDLNDAAAPYGLMYAPDPASYRTSTLGGNIATNAGGLRCAKYGVTRDAILGLDVVLADGTLISTGRRTLKGVAGYDLTGLFVGSEGTLGVVVRATVRLRHLPPETRTIAAYFPNLRTAFAGVLAVGRARVQPAITELVDKPTLSMLDEQFGSGLASHGGALLLLQTDGYGAAAEAAVVEELLSRLGADINPPDKLTAEDLVGLRRRTRGAETATEYGVGEDVAVPRSKLLDYARGIESIAARHRLALRVVAHAGDGNLHPTFVAPRTPDASPHETHDIMARLDHALEESIRLALRLGGTITGEHGVGIQKLRWLPWEHREEALEIQRRLKNMLDPRGILNPGKAIPA